MYSEQISEQSRATHRSTGISWTVAVLAAVLAVLAGPSAQAGKTKVEVSEVWVRASVPGQSVSGAFMRLKSNEQASLIAAECTCAQIAEIHFSTNLGGVARMRKVDGVALPANTPDKLEPGGYHLMLMGLNTPLKSGANVTLKLRIETKQGGKLTLNVKAPVRALGE